MCGDHLATYSYIYMKSLCLTLGIEWYMLIVSIKIYVKYSLPKTIVTFIFKRKLLKIALYR